MSKTVFHHSALTSGYVSVKNTNGIKESYNGLYGKGYTVKKNNPNSTRYCIIMYFVEQQ